MFHVERVCGELFLRGIYYNYVLENGLQAYVILKLVKGFSHYALHA